MIVCIILSPINKEQSITSSYFTKEFERKFNNTCLEKERSKPTIHPRCSKLLDYSSKSFFTKSNQIAWFNSSPAAAPFSTNSANSASLKWNMITYWKNVPETSEEIVVPSRWFKRATAPINSSTSSQLQYNTLSYRKRHSRNDQRNCGVIQMIHADRTSKLHIPRPPPPPHLSDVTL